MEQKSMIEEQLENAITKEMENKHFPSFSKKARHMGNGVYGIPYLNLYSSDTRDLFLMFVAIQEGIEFTIE